MKLGQKTYNRGLGHGVITEITEYYYEVKYDKITVQYPHKDLSKWVVVACLILMGLFFSSIILLAI